MKASTERGKKQPADAVRGRVSRRTKALSLDHSPPNEEVGASRGAIARGCRRFAAAAVCSALLATTAEAASITLSPSTVAPGGIFDAALVDTVADFLAADVTVSFDAAVLTLLDVGEGTVTAGFTVLAGPLMPGPPATVDVSIADFAFPPVSPVSGSGSLVVARFRVNPDAPLGMTAISFVDRFPDEPDSYHFVAEATTLTVAAALPEAPAWSLTAMALVALGCLVQRRSITPDRHHEEAGS